MTEEPEWPKLAKYAAEQSRFREHTITIIVRLIYRITWLRLPGIIEHQKLPLNHPLVWLVLVMIL
jgi:hypothetical protein